MKIIVIGFIVRIFLSIINLYFIPLPGGENDALAFHLKGVEFKNHLEDGNSYYDFEYTFGWLYSIYLGYIYYFFGTSKFLGSFLSCLTWLISAFVIRELLIKLNLKQQLINLSLVGYCFLFPSSLVYPSLILRSLIYFYFPIYYFYF